MAGQIDAGQCHCLEVLSRSPSQTRAIGRAMGEAARPGDVFLLSGELGAGKTCLTQGVMWGLGVDEYARSPTFVLVAEHHGRLPLYHLDLFRLGNVGEVLDLGLEEYLGGQGVCVVEWADRAPAAFPGRSLRVRLDRVAVRTRRLSFDCDSGDYHALLDRVRHALPPRGVQ